MEPRAQGLRPRAGMDGSSQQAELGGPSEAELSKQRLSGGWEGPSPAGGEPLLSRVQAKVGEL